MYHGCKPQTQRNEGKHSVHWDNLLHIFCLPLTDFIYLEKKLHQLALKSVTVCSLHLDLWKAIADARVYLMWKKLPKRSTEVRFSHPREREVIAWTAAVLKHVSGVRQREIPGEFRGTQILQLKSEYSKWCNGFSMSQVLHLFLGEQASRTHFVISLCYPNRKVEEIVAERRRQRDSLFRTAKQKLNWKYVLQ